MIKLKPYIKVGRTASFSWRKRRSGGGDNGNNVNGDSDNNSDNNGNGNGNIIILSRRTPRGCRMPHGQGHGIIFITLLMGGGRPLVLNQTR